MRKDTEKLVSYLSDCLKSDAMAEMDIRDLLDMSGLVREQISFGFWFFEVIVLSLLPIILLAAICFLRDVAIDWSGFLVNGDAILISLGIIAPFVAKAIRSKASPQLKATILSIISVIEGSIYATIKIGDKLNMKVACGVSIVFIVIAFTVSFTTQVMKKVSK